MKAFFFAAVCATSVASAANFSIPSLNSRGVLQLPEYVVGGDMILKVPFEEVKRWEVKHKNRFQIPYELSDKLYKSQTMVFTWAFEHISSRTNIDFVPRAGQTPFLSVDLAANPGVLATLGIQKEKAQILIASRGTSPRHVLHCLMHILGFGHPHQRKDRDDYLTLHEENVKSFFERAFDYLDPMEEFGFPYDTSSVMHFPEESFGKDDARTLQMKFSEDRQKVNNSRAELSQCDVAAINKVYPGSIKSQPCVGGELLSIYKPTTMCLKEASQNTCNKYCLVMSDLYIGVPPYSPKFCEANTSKTASGAPRTTPVAFKTCECECKPN